MPAPLDRATYAAITRLTLLQWRPDAIAEREHVSTRVVYKIEANLSHTRHLEPPGSVQLAVLVGLQPGLESNLYNTSKRSHGYNIQR